MLNLNKNIELNEQHSRPESPYRALGYWAYASLRLNAVNLTRLLARTAGERIGFVYVGGYPKSGTTWMSRLMAHYLKLPYPDGHFLPLSFECVVHHHWDYHPAFDHSIQVIRDGRDVMVSLYMNIMKNFVAQRQILARTAKVQKVLIDNIGHYATICRRFHRLFGDHFDPWDVERNLPIFIEAAMQAPFLPAVNRPWPDYIRTWQHSAKQTIFIKYEDMLQNPAGTLSLSLAKFLDREINNEELAYTIDRFSFRQWTKRKPGEEDRTSFARKGISGDWQNYFNREACQIFDHFAGNILVDLGYESDHRWIEDESQSPAKG